MRRVLISALIVLIWAVPASAQKWAPGPDAKSDPAQNEDGSQNPSAESILQTIRSDLEHAGLTDVQLIPSSFLVRAKDQDGKPVIMVVTPDSIRVLTEVPSGQGSGQSSTSGTGAPETK
jgi:hypothetical protein